MENICYPYRSTYCRGNVHSKRQKRQCGGGGLMYWGMLMPNGLVALKRIDGKMDSKKYVHLLESYTIPIMNLNTNPNYKFIQDNATIHVSTYSKMFLENLTFETLNWPARSPDINLMENVWKMISDIVYLDEQPLNINQLEERVIKAVHLINTEKRDVTKSLFNTFLHRLTRILISKGNILN